jgi:signal transduction histidine kinase/CheY-like chemotaxis protein
MERVLLRFVRLAMEAADPAEVMPVLLDLAVEELGANAAAALRVTDEGRLAVVQQRNLPERIGTWTADLELLGADLGQALLGAAGPPFVHAEVLPLVADRNVYGVLVLLDRTGKTRNAERVELTRALVDIAAAVVGRAVQYAELERAFQELKASREALAQSEKLRSLGQMAAGISHDLKNILNPLALQIDVMRHALAHGKPISDDMLARMQRAVRTGADTVERLRGFSRQSNDQPAEPTDLQRVAQAALDICAPRLREHSGLEVRLEHGGGPKSVLVRTSEMVNAIVNLVVNACDAMAGRGTIVVRAGADDGGGWVEVSDDGPGMPPDVERRVFEPFFTTKQEGTGLGLAMVYAFVQRHAGKITLDTAVGRGTTVRMWFPGAAPIAKPTAPEPVAAPSQRVLVVDDDVAARKALCMLLDGEGFEVASAADGAEALRVLGSFEPAALVVDRFMPGMDGAELLTRGREGRTLPAVIMSGADADDVAIAPLLRQPRTEHLPKPIDIDRLVAMLRRLLAPETPISGISPPREPV